MTVGVRTAVDVDVGPERCRPRNEYPHCHAFLDGPSMLMLVRSAAALATMRLVLLYDDVDVYALESVKASSGVFGDSF